MEFKDKIIVVTGAGKGIGKSIAEEFCKKGAIVIVASRGLDECNQVCKNLKKEKGKAIPIKCDISKPTDVKALFLKIKKKFGKVDVLVNNAGIYPFKPFKEMTNKEWNTVIDVNLNGTFYCTKEAIKLMKKGNIINISSIAGIRGFPMLSHYCTSKGAMNQLTTSLAMELAPNIRVNAILPGLILTPGTKILGEDGIKEFVKKIPVARAGVPKDIANLTLFLASKKSSFITGQLIVADGGQTTMS